MWLEIKRNYFGLNKSEEGKNLSKNERSEAIVFYKDRSNLEDAIKELKLIQNKERRALNKISLLS